MLVVMKPHAAEEEIAAVVEKIRSLGLTPHPIPGAQRVAIGVTGNKVGLDPAQFETMPGVADAIRVSQPFKLVSREVKEEDTVIDVGGVPLGGNALAIMAGPCSVESREQILEVAHAVKAAGARFLRGGAFKPRTSPYEFQGLGEEGLKLLALAREQTGLKIVTEVMDAEALPLVADYADVLQIGARNMQNFSLVKRLGDLRKPILLKRSRATGSSRRCSPSSRRPRCFSPRWASTGSSPTGSAVACARWGFARRSGRSGRTSVAW
jgi:3-deoxy-7-phosphoheptulonate synthase